MQKIASQEVYEACRRALVAERRRRGLTQWELAGRLGPGISQSDISKIERGERRVDIAEFIVVAEALGVSAAALIAKIERLL